jgi:hypothetical protein
LHYASHLKLPPIIWRIVPKNISIASLENFLVSKY